MSLLRQGAKLTFAASDLVLPSPPGPRLLIYHQVGTGASRQMEVTTDDFVWQLDWLVSNREVVDLDTAIKRWHEPDADRLVVLTFDDGYEDTFTTAFPRLRERGFPFALYIATGMIDGASGEGVRSLTWEQIEEMAASGLLTVGAHTHTHRDLRGVGYDETLSELGACNQLIEDRLGVVPRHFAYPWGYWDEPAHRAVSETYTTAVLGSSPWPTPFDRHKIHRFPVQLSDGKRWFPSRLRSGLLAEEWLRRRLRGYRGP